jgi:two-component system sensor histidine kinase HydH
MISIHRGGRPHAALVLTLMVIITILLYITQIDREAEFFYHLDVIFQGLFFIPIVLACLWFGLVGGLLVSAGVTMGLLPYLLLHWEGMSAADLNRLLQIVVYFVDALVLGKAIENQRRQEKRAKEVENLAAIGKSMAAVAHDMKTPLISIGGFSNLIKRHLSEDFPHRDKIDIVIQETEYLERMIKDMLAFSRPIELNLGDHDVGRVVAETLSMTEEVARRRGVELKSRVSSNPGMVLIDAMRMTQVLTNLVTNAIEASPAGEVVMVGYYRKSGSLVFEVVDCGCGIPLDQRPEVFLPFFTKKKEGTGLGLSNAKKIVEAHGGYLEILDNPNRGLTFRVVIPAKSRK